ncbi:MAG: hypothetical protein CVT89_06495 [Candidatus Altiarchaeales archaeon HGW-Altiarchaeales-2]|nr:MAG: hypothetical protein CVT89_06495 [Candidatus Altiarchaeales archaeon HGW-Altiarchaeales-2]
MDKFSQILEEFTEECRNSFGNKLISIILLPKDRIARHKILNDVKLKFIYKYHIRISPIFIEPCDLSVKNINPLIYGILTGYRVLYDSGNSWNTFTAKIKPKIYEKKPVYIEGEQQWKIAEMI